METKEKKKLTLEAEPQSQEPATGTQSADYQTAGYTESASVKQAEDMLKQQMANKPGAYQSQWQTQLNDVLQKILNREEFSYDLNGDALYQQYKDQYVNQGRMAMMDTVGQTAALTGGYGNSYAQNAGQQAYQGHLQQLNDKIPELYQLALSMYNQEGQNLMDQYALLGAQEEQDYGRYMDQLSAHNAEVDRLQSIYDAERDYDYGKWADERNFGYQQERDAAADKQWQAEFDEAVRQWNALHGGDAGGSSGGNGGGNPGTDSGDDGTVPDTTGNGKYTADEVEQAQKFLNIPITGEWDTESVAAAKKKGYGHLGAVIDAMQERDGDHALDYLQSDGAYYDQLLGAVSTAKGLYSKKSSGERQANYQELVAAISDAYKSGRITAEQRDTLFRIATPSSR